MKKPTIGFIAGDLNNPYGKLLRDTLTVEFERAGFATVAEALSPARGLEEIAREWSEQPETKGIAVAVASSLENDAALDRLAFEQSSRLVLIGRVHERVDSVSADFEEGGLLATRHLVEKGHRRIAFVGAEFSDARRVSRLKGYLNALKHFGLPVDPDAVVGMKRGASGSFATRQGGKEAVNLLFGAPRPPTAIFARNDFVALGVLEALQLRGASVPGDVSLVGFDGTDEGAAVAPPLTSVVQPTVEQARLAAKYLLDGMSSSVRGKAPQRTVMSCRLQVRASTASPPR